MASAATLRTQKRSRETGSSAGRHWLTIASEKACCNQCGRIIKPGGEMVYRHTPREILCILHADQRRLPYKPSLKWEQSRRRAAA